MYFLFVSGEKRKQISSKGSNQVFIVFEIKKIFGLLFLLIFSKDANPFKTFSKGHIINALVILKTLDVYSIFTNINKIISFNNYSRLHSNISINEKKYVDILK